MPLPAQRNSIYNYTEMSAPCRKRLVTRKSMLAAFVSSSATHHACLFPLPALAASAAELAAGALLEADQQRTADTASETAARLQDVTQAAEASWLYAHPEIEVSAGYKLRCAVLQCAVLSLRSCCSTSAATTERATKILRCPLCA